MGVDSNVSAWSRLSAAAVHTVVRLGFALLCGGSRINHHRAGVLSLEGCPLVHSVLTPLTIPASGLRNTHRIILLF